MNGDLTILSVKVHALGNWDIADALDSLDSYVDAANVYLVDRPSPKQADSIGQHAARAVLGLISDCARLGIDIQEEIARELGRHR